MKLYIPKHKTELEVIDLNIDTECSLYSSFMLITVGLTFISNTKTYVDLCYLNNIIFSNINTTINDIGDVIIYDYKKYDNTLSDFQCHRCRVENIDLNNNIMVFYCDYFKEVKLDKYRIRKRKLEKIKRI